MCIFQVKKLTKAVGLQFAEGKVWKVKTGAKLRAVHCYEIGVHAKSKGKFAMAIDWLKSAILLAYTDYTVDQAVVLSAMFETLETVFFKAERKSGTDSINSRWLFSTTRRFRQPKAI